MNNLSPCWYCGAQPERLTKELIGVQWAAYSCCTTGNYSPHEENTVGSWNRIQKALDLLRAVERLSHFGRFRVGPLEGQYSAVVFERRIGTSWAAQAESAADALINLLARIDS